MNRIGIQEIAKLASVSIGTVDRALHGRKGIREETRKKILRIATSIGYTPNLAARSLSVGGATMRIGVCIPRESHLFYDQVRDGILDEAKRFEHLGVEIVYRPVDRLGVGEEERVREMLADNLRALIVTPGDPARLAPLIHEAEENNVRVICVASDAPTSGRSTVVCVDPELNGRLAADLMSRFVPAGARVAIVTGMLRTEDHCRKTEGFCTAFRQYCPGGEVVEVIEGLEDDDVTFRKCNELLGKDRDIAGLYVNIAICLPVCFALTAQGLAGKVSLIATDLFREMVPYFEKGTISASIYQRPYIQGQSAVRLVVDHLLAGHPIPPTHYLNPNIVMRSNLHLFREIRHHRQLESARVESRL